MNLRDLVVGHATIGKAAGAVEPQLLPTTSLNTLKVGTACFTKSTSRSTRVYLDGSSCVEVREGEVESLPGEQKTCVSAPREETTRSFRGSTTPRSNRLNRLCGGTMSLQGL